MIRIGNTQYRLYSGNIRLNILTSPVISDPYLYVLPEEVLWISDHIDATYNVISNQSWTVIN